MIMYFHEDGILRGGGVEICVEADSRRVCLELVAAEEPCVTLENVVGVPSDCVLELSDVVDTAVGRASGGVRGAAEEAAGWVGDEATSGDSSEPEVRSRDVLRRTCTELRVGGDEGEVRVLPKGDNPIQASRVLGDFFLPCILDDELEVSISVGTLPNGYTRTAPLPRLRTDTMEAHQGRTVRAQSHPSVTAQAHQSAQAHSTIRSRPTIQV